MRRVLAAAAVAASMVVAFPALPAHAATPRFVATAALMYWPGDVTIDRGDPLTLVNLEPAAHDVTALDTDAGGPLFLSATIEKPGQTAKVVGVEALDRGIYEFYCSVHPEMRGTVSVA